MTEFNFDIDQIANNTVAKVDKTTEIIETNTSSACNFFHSRTIIGLFGCSTIGIFY